MKPADAVNTGDSAIDPSNANPSEQSDGDCPPSPIIPAIDPPLIAPGDRLLEMADNVHGRVKLHPFCRPVVNHELFQRLERVRQLGLCHAVFPTASHSRYEHSLGVGHLAGKLMLDIQRGQPILAKHTDTAITESDIICVYSAGLLHDVGHPPYSHLFECVLKDEAKQCRRKLLENEKDEEKRKYLEKRASECEEWEHEDVSKKLVAVIWRDLTEVVARYRLTDTDLKFIQELIDPPKKELQEAYTQGSLHKKWPLYIKGRPVHKAWMYEIVSNWRTESTWTS